MTLLYGGLGRFDRLAAFFHAGANVELLAKSTDLSTALFVAGDELSKCFHLGFELVAKRRHPDTLSAKDRRRRMSLQAPLLVIYTTRTVGISDRPESLILPFPKLIGEVMLELINDVSNAFIHYAKGLVRPEVSSDICEVFIFEQEIVTIGRVEHKDRGGRGQLGDGAENVLEPLLRISKLAQQRYHERLRPVDVVLLSVVDICAALEIWKAL